MFQMGKMYLLGIPVTLDIIFFLSQNRHHARRFGLTPSPVSQVGIADSYVPCPFKGRFEEKHKPRSGRFRIETNSCATCVFLNYETTSEQRVCV